MLLLKPFFMRQFIFTISIAAALLATSCGYSQKSNYPDPPQAKKGTTFAIQLKDEEWKAKLTADQYYILRQEGTERAFTGKYDHFYKKGTYYFYFPHPSGTDWNKTWKIGVATSKKPASDFTSQGYIPEVGGFAMIDPCVFVDDDKQAYLIYGGGSKCQGGKLKDNMMEVDGKMQDMTGLQDFHEAAWLFKRKGIYYLTYADNNRRENQLRYAISKNPLGPWEYKGVYLEPTGCDTSHGSVVEFKGQWYAFYHNKSISGKGNLRSICVDKLYFNPDGTIQKVIQTK